EGVAGSHEVLAGPQQIADVASYVSLLERDGIRGVGDGTQVDLGSAIYARHCASCHGENAEGDDARSIPKISGQHAGYLTRQVYDAVDGRRPLLRKSHRRFFAPLAFEEVRGLAD